MHCIRLQLPLAVTTTLRSQERMSGTPCCTRQVIQCRRDTHSNCIKVYIANYGLPFPSIRKTPNVGTEQGNSKGPYPKQFARALISTLTHKDEEGINQWMVWAFFLQKQGSGIISANSIWAFGHLTYLGVSLHSSETKYQGVILY